MTEHGRAPRRVWLGSAGPVLHPVELWFNDLVAIQMLVLERGGNVTHVSVGVGRLARDQYESFEHMRAQLGPVVLHDVSILIEVPSTTLGTTVVGLGRQAIDIAPSGEPELERAIVAILERRRRRLPTWLLTRLGWYSTVHLTPFAERTTFWGRYGQAIIQGLFGLACVVLGFILGRAFPAS